ncbi:MAG: serine/threonine protein kinase [Myxococcales bacterium]|nr:serine/threonine protein kinase [Myxococcales bacterium]
MKRASDAPDEPREARGVDRAASTLSGGPRRSVSGESELVCVLCDRVNPADARFCAGCGHQFGADAFDDDGDADPLLGRVIADRYRMEELLGRGGMGVVYRVEHVNIGKLMAMKLLHGALARDKDTVKRFKREAELVSRLDHANTVQVFDFGQSEGMMFLVMEYLPGRDLGQVIKEDGPLSFARVARIGAQVCGSVGQAHELGVVHRDLKPENVMLIEGSAVRDFVKVLDFGLAKLREQEEMGGQSITRQGSILGTPYYMAPEHIRGEPVDQRSDVYALGALMYKAVTGAPPFWATTPVGVLTMHLTDDVEPPSERAPKRNIPKEADEILLKAMRKNPADRYQTMHGLRDALLEYLESVGQAAGLESLRLGSGLAIPSDSGRQRHLATRVDVDEFESRLRRRSLVGVLTAILVLVALLVGGVYAWRQRPAEVATEEREPNDELTQANPLPPGVEMRGHIGARLDENRSDADIYELRNPGGDRRTVRIDVSAIPNMDLMFELYREGITTAPLLVADSAGMGQAESVPNFVIDGPTYYLRVRELWESGRLPSENVSDPYTVSWRFVEPEEGDEEEVNDSIELSGSIAMNGSVRGFVGWGGDEDVFCLEAEATNVVARVEAVPSLDLVLSRIDRTTGRATEFDEHGLGAGERTDVLERARPGRYCFEVSAHRPKVGAGNDPDQRYVLHLEHGPEDP